MSFFDISVQEDSVRPSMKPTVTLLSLVALRRGSVRDSVCGRFLSVVGVAFQHVKL